MANVPVKCAGCGYRLRADINMLGQETIRRNGKEFRVLFLKCDCGSKTYVQLDDAETLQQLKWLETVAKQCTDSGKKQSKKFDKARKRLRSMRKKIVLENNNQTFEREDGTTFVLRLVLQDGA